MLNQPIASTEHTYFRIEEFKDGLKVITHLRRGIIIGGYAPKRKHWVSREGTLDDLTDDEFLELLTLTSPDTDEQR